MMAPANADGWVDANVLVRHLTGDPPELAQRASELLDRADAGELTLRLHAVMLVEVVWVLETYYRVPRPEIARVVGGLITAGGIRCAEAEAALAALDDYAGLNVDYPDAFLARRAAGSGSGLVYTFDRHFDVLGAPNQAP